MLDQRVLIQTRLTIKKSDKVRTFDDRIASKMENNTIQTVSLIKNSPKTKLYNVRLTRKSFKISSTATGSTAEMSDANNKTSDALTPDENIPDSEINHSVTPKL
jgi:hypothetical protein